MAAADVSCWTGPLVWNLRHLMMLLREYENFCNSHRPHRALDQAAPQRPLPDRVTDLDHFRVRRHDRAGGNLISGMVSGIMPGSAGKG